MQIKQIQIKYFRSIYNQTIDFGDLNIVAGINDAGKSNLLKALNLFFNNETGWKESFSFSKDFSLQRLQEFEKNRKLKDAKEIVIKITFDEIKGYIPVWEKKWRSDGSVHDNQYDASLKKQDRSSTGFKPRSRIPTMLGKVRYLYIPALKGPDFISYLIGQLSNILSEKASKDIRGAASGFEGKLANYLSDITKDIKEALQIDSLLKLPHNLVNIFENMEFSDKNGIALTHRGDGIRTRHIPILLNKISSLHDSLRDKGELYNHFIWGYEEPENNVELTASFLMAENFLKKYSPSHQILISTHSPAFYGLPERFFSDWKQGHQSIFRYAAFQSNGITTYTNTSPEDLDPLFLLPAITPYIENERAKILKLQNEIENLSKTGTFFEKPTIIVEGPIDEIIFRKSLEIFFKEKKQDINIISPQDPEDGGGAQFVKDHLIIWESKQKHTPPEKRVKAIGYFDDDDAGRNDLEEYRKFSKSNYAHGCTYKNELRANDHFLKLKKSELGAEVPYILENLYSPSLWIEAEKKGYLEEKEDTIQYLSKAATSLLTTTTKTINDLCIHKEICLYVTHQIKKDKKMQIAKFIEKAPEETAKEYLYFFERIITQCLKKIGVL